MNSSATKKDHPTNPYSVVTPDKVVVGKPTLKHQSYKLKKKKKKKKGLAKVPKAMTARKNLSYSAYSTAKIGATLDCNKDKTLPNPSTFQSPVKTLFLPEIIEINSEDSDDDIEGTNSDPVNDPDSNIPITLTLTLTFTQMGKLPQPRIK